MDLNQPTATPTAALIEDTTATNTENLNEAFKGDEFVGFKGFTKDFLGNTPEDQAVSLDIILMQGNFNQYIYEDGFNNFMNNMREKALEEEKFEIDFQIGIDGGEIKFSYDPDNIDQPFTLDGPRFTFNYKELPETKDFVDSLVSFYPGSSINKLTYTSGGSTYTFLVYGGVLSIQNNLGQQLTFKRAKGHIEHQTNNSWEPLIFMQNSAETPEQ